MGLDAVRAAAESGIGSVTMITRKPPGGLAAHRTLPITASTWTDSAHR